MQKRGEEAGITPPRVQPAEKGSISLTLVEASGRRAGRPSLTSSCRLYTFIPGFHKGKGKKKNFKKREKLTKKEVRTVICLDVNFDLPL